MHLSKPTFKADNGWCRNDFTLPITYTSSYILHLINILNVAAGITDGYERLMAERNQLVFIDKSTAGKREFTVAYDVQIYSIGH